MDAFILPPWLFETYIFLLGAIVGSFLNVVISRLPEGLSVVRPRSRCPKCGGSIRWYLNIPVLSWILLRGKCATCAQPISVRYPIVELLTALLFLAVARRYGQSEATVLGLILAGSLIAITFIDLDVWEIPDEISLPGILLGAALRPWAFDVPWYDGLLGVLVGGGALWAVRAGFFLLRKKEGLGFGDVKLIAMIGAFLGAKAVLPVLMIASVTGIAGGVVMLALGFKEDERAPEDDTAATAEPEPEAQPEAETEAAAESEPGAEEDSDEEEEDWVPPKNAVPFGPFLALGALAQLLFGAEIERFFFLLTVP